MSKDYLGHHEVKPEDHEAHGVKGMKWGQRRSSAQLRTAAAARANQPDHIKKAATSSTKPAGAETSSARYDRLKAAAKNGEGKNMSDDDLKFFNARTEALKKVNALNQKDDWLRETTKNVLRTAAQKQMQAVADSIADKYISGPAKEVIGKHVTAEEAAKKAAEALAKKAAKP